MELIQIFTLLIIYSTIDTNAQLFSDLFQGLQFGQTQGFTLAPIAGYNTRKPIKTTKKHNRVTESYSSHEERDNGHNDLRRTKSSEENYAYTTQKTHRKTIKNNNKRVVTQNWNNQNYNNVNYQTTKPKNKNKDTITFTTQNPFFNHPGVKPANVDQNRPPITNKPTYRPITQRPSHSDRPNRPIRPAFDTDAIPTYDKPAYERPSFESGTVKPVEDGIAFVDENEGPPMTPGVDEDAMSDAQRKRHLDIAEQMCNKYKSMTTSHIQAIPLIPSPEPVNVNVSQCTPVNIPLIVGGKIVSIKEFPHMALVGWNSLQGGYSWKCGGSLISDRFVLTAAHCAYQERDETVGIGTPRVVSLGSSFLNDPRAMVVKVAAVIRHPKYKLPMSYYDIALLKLARTVKFTDRIRPACLGTPPRVGSKIIATGWGKTSTVGEQSLELRSVALPVWDVSECARALGVTRKLPRGVDRRAQLCAGDARGGKDTCQGDSGGPAQIQDGCLWRVTAVTSLGRSCGAPDTPGLYAIAQIPFISAHIFEGVKLENKPNKPNYDSQQIYYDYNNRNNNDNNGNNAQNNNENNQNSYNNNNQNSHNNNNQNSHNNNNQHSNNNNNQHSYANYDNEKKTVNYDTGSTLAHNYNQNSNDRYDRRTQEGFNHGFNVRNEYGSSSDNDNPYNLEEDRNIWWT